MNAALLLTALFNGAWQGALLCAGAVLAFRLCRRLNATTMFTVWSVLLGIAVLLPIANYAFASKPYTIDVKIVRKPVGALREPVAVRQHFAPAHVSAPLPVTPPQPALRERAAAAAGVLYSYASIVLWLLALAALVRLIILARDVVRMLAARRRVRFIEPPVILRDSIARPYSFAASSEFTSPCVLGFWPALIVMPEELLRDADAKLHSIVLHEREHVRRFDDVQNVVQRFIGALAFFCPGVRIALRELALYREQICDDAAINGTGDRVSYAMTLTRMTQWAQGRGAPVPSLIFKRKQLLHRLEVLLDSAVSHSLLINRRFALTAAGTLAIAALLVLHVQVPVIAESIVAPAAPPQPAHVRVVLKVPARPTPATVRLPAPEKPAKLERPAKSVELAKRVKPVPPKVAQVVRLLPKPARIDTKPLPPLEAGRTDIVALAVIRQNELDAGAAAPVAPPAIARTHTEDLLDVLNAMGLRNFSVDQVIALRDHGVSGSLIRAAVHYFGTNVGVNDLTALADHGVSGSYLEALHMAGVTGIPTDSVVMLADHGVSIRLIATAMSYFSPRPSAADLAYLSDHGVTEDCIRGYQRAGLSGASPADVAKLEDHGVVSSYIARIRKMYPRANIDEIIRLHDAGI